MGLYQLGFLIVALVLAGLSAFSPFTPDPHPYRLRLLSGAFFFYVLSILSTYK